MRPQVSIIVRTVGTRPQLLLRALKSISAQTITSLEVVIVEGGGKKTKPLIKQWQSKEPFAVKYIYQKDRRRSFLGNIGLLNASGKYVCFLDDDDLLRSNHLEELLNLKKKNPNSVAVYSLAQQHVQFIGTLLERKRLIGEHPYFRERLYLSNHLAIQSVITEKRFIDKIGGFDLRLDALEDWDLWLRLSDLGQFSSTPICTSEFFTKGGWINSERRKRNHAEAFKYIQSKYPLKRLGTTLDLSSINNYDLQNQIISFRKVSPPITRWLRLLLGL